MNTLNSTVPYPVSAVSGQLPMKRILAIDPGTTESGWCLFERDRLVLSGVMPNPDVLRMLSAKPDPWGCVLAIEMIASYGMPVGREVFESCVWIGRFMQAWHQLETMLPHADQRNGEEK